MRVSSFSSFVAACAVCALPGLTAVGCGGSTTATNSDSGVGIVLPTTDAGGGSKTDGSTGTGNDGSSPGTPDAGFDTAVAPPTDAALNTFPSFLPSVPQVEKLGGSVLTSPLFIPVFFAGDTDQPQLSEFVAAVGQSQYWVAAVTEYGVGPATSTAPVILDSTLPAAIDDSDLQTWLGNEIGTDPRFGALPSEVFDGGPIEGGILDAATNNATAPAGAVYVLFVPGTTTVTLQGSTSCNSFGGYHNSFYYAGNGSTVVYAVVPRCPNFNPDLQGIQEITGAASHELVEAVTDPNVGAETSAQIGYDQLDANHFLWEEVLGGSELGDMCAQFPGAFYAPTEPALAAFKVQRIWSNKAAAAGLDPCVPALPLAEEPFYFNSVPKFGEMPAEFFGQNITTIAGSAVVNVPTTIEVDLFSNVSTNGMAWTVQAYDADQYVQGTQADLVFSSAVMGVNGDKVFLTVTNNGSSSRSVHPFLLVSSLGELQNWWIGVIVNG